MEPNQSPLISIISHVITKISWITVLQDSGRKTIWDTILVTKYPILSWNRSGVISLWTDLYRSWYDIMTIWYQVKGYDLRHEDNMTSREGICQRFMSWWQDMISSGCWWQYNSNWRLMTTWHQVKDFPDFKLAMRAEGGVRWGDIVITTGTSHMWAGGSGANTGLLSVVS